MTVRANIGDVCVIGGGNSALTIALDLVKNTKSVTIIQDLEKLTGEPINVEKIWTSNNLE